MWVVLVGAVVANYPLVQLRSLANEQTRFLLSDAATNWSDTAFTSQPVTGFPQGYGLVTIFTNGIPSTSQVILVAPVAPPTDTPTATPSTTATPSFSA